MGELGNFFWFGNSGGWVSEKMKEVKKREVYWIRKDDRRGIRMIELLE